MRISGLALVAAACGGAQTRPTADPCQAYGAAMRAPLAHVARASDGFDTSTLEAGVRSSRDFAAALDEERGRMVGVATGGGELDAGHRELVTATGELAGAFRELATTLEGRDRERLEPARRELHDAMAAWKSAAAHVRRACPGL